VIAQFKEYEDIQQQLNEARFGSYGRLDGCCVRELLHGSRLVRGNTAKWSSAPRRSSVSFFLWCLCVFGRLRKRRI